MVLVNDCGNGFHSLSLECVHERERVFAPNELISSKQILLMRMIRESIDDKKKIEIKATIVSSDCWHSCPRLLGCIVSWRSLLKMQFLVHSRSDNGLRSLINLINEMSYAENSVCHVSSVFIVWYIWTQTVVISSISVFNFIYTLS